MAEVLLSNTGAVSLRKCADQSGLSKELRAVFAQMGAGPLRDRGVVLIQLAVAIALGATSPPA